MKRVLVTGASGLLGGNIMMLVSGDWDVVGIVHHHQIKPPAKNIRLIAGDLLSEQLSDLIKDFTPDAVIHCAAQTNVDRCDRERTEAYRLNVEMTSRMVAFCAKTGSHLVHISTDHFFDGNIVGAHKEHEAPAPVNYYGETKLEAENIVSALHSPWTIVRTNFFGFQIQDKNDFAGWIVEALHEDRPISLFTDVLFSPLLVNSLIKYLIRIVDDTLTGVMHIAAHDGCSKYEFGMKLANELGLDTRRINQCRYEDANMAIARPRNMQLDTRTTEKIFGESFPHVNESIHEYKKLMRQGYEDCLKQLAIV